MLNKSDAQTRKRLRRIAQIFPQNIDSVQIHDNGEDSLVLEINGEWMFRFPRHAYAEQALEREKQFLPRLARISPLPIPTPQYVRADFVGYRKIVGAPLTRELFEALSPVARHMVAQQIGAFLSAVHTFPISEAYAMGVNESWGGWRQRAFESFEQNIAPRLSVTARKRVLEFFDRYFSMEYRRVLIHGDFYPPDHVFFDAERQQLGGVIDFGDLTIEDSATDFKSLYTDFGVEFFREVLGGYTGEVDDHLVDRIQIRVRAHPLFDASYALEYHQPERFARQLLLIEATFGSEESFYAH